MDRSYITPNLKFKRHAEDGLIHPICQQPIAQGDIVCYEIPVKSTSQSFKLDIFRYTMQCVYSGESLFPCAFNQEPPEDDIKVFFEYVFRTKYRRPVSERLALALYDHNRTNAPFLYKTLGIFGKSANSNCVRVSYQNGESFLAATKGIVTGEVLRVSEDNIAVPTLKEDQDFAATFQLMAAVDISKLHLFTKALSYRAKAAVVRPNGRVVHVNSKLDPDLDKRMAKYTIDRDLGITEFHAGLGRLDKKLGEDDSLELEELYNKLNDAFEADTEL
ncbi:unnamed protein product [Ectocarpus sp. 12 AP-2014]